MVRRKTPRVHLLRTLNIYGLDHLDPVLLAALADEQPLLLIGAHGTAKSELLNRVAAALGLEHRHYNASLISFDDLLGYPVPDGEGLRYLRTPGDLWDAESVFFDEISRCRPESQNKLFSVVHERRVQGLQLENLRYRWAAMNPPPSPDGDTDGEWAYTGSLPLDPALADRFAYVLRMPEFGDFSPAVRRVIIARGGEASADVQANLVQLIKRVRSKLARTSADEHVWTVAWVDALVAPLREARLEISGRRAVMLAQSAAAVYAAGVELGLGATADKWSLADAAWWALKCGLPHRGFGVVIPEAKLLAVHRAACQSAGEPVDGPWRQIREERDPVRRIALALDSPATVVGRIELSTLVSDAWAGLTVPERFVLARNLLPVLAEADRVTAATYEQLAGPFERVAAFVADGTYVAQLPRSAADGWSRVNAVVSAMQKVDHPGAVELGNTFYTLFAVEREDFDPVELAMLDTEWRAMFRADAAPCKVAA